MNDVDERRRRREALWSDCLSVPPACRPRVPKLLAQYKQKKSDGQRRLMTFVYKRVGNLEIQVDVYRPASDTPCPVLLWIHGAAALIMGDRGGVDRRLRSPLLRAGLCDRVDRLPPMRRRHKASANYRGPARRLRVAARPGAQIVQRRHAPHRRRRRLGWRIPHADDWVLRQAATGGAGFAVGLRRHRRRLVHQAQRVLS